MYLHEGFDSYGEIYKLNAFGEWEGIIMHAIVVLATGQPLEEESGHHRMHNSSSTIVEEEFFPDENLLSLK